ncbi:hypothetical protein TNCV_2596761 [Trichonephila clavipes]|nr:hypothetical protein TNCV_2596761 [Trichonephila clavipes]
MGRNDAAIRRYADKNGWTVADFSVLMYQPLRHLPLTPTHFRTRLRWCLARSSLTHAEWGRIVFKGESRIKLCPDDHRICVCRHRRQRADPASTIARRKCPQPGVMVRW